VTEVRPRIAPNNAKCPKTVKAESLARGVIAGCAPRAIRHTWWAAACATCCWAPPKDFDVATDARPDRIMSLFPNSGLVGAHFGVVLVRDGLGPGGSRHLPQR
jgi:hypothetical protein